MVFTQPLPPMPPLAGMAMDAERAAMHLVDSWTRPDIAATTVKAAVWASATATRGCRLCCLRACDPCTPGLSRHR